MLRFSDWISKEKVFEGQHTKEQVIAVIHRHWYALFWPVVKIFAGLILVFIVFRLAGFWSTFSWYIFFIWLVVGGIYILICWFNWARDKYILTDERILNLQQKSLFSRAVYETPYENIQDLSYEVNGFMATLLRYGNVRVQTAGTKEGIILEQVANPRKLKSKIVKIRDIVMKDKDNLTAKELITELKKEIKK